MEKPGQVIIRGSERVGQDTDQYPVVGSRQKRVDGGNNKPARDTQEVEIKPQTKREEIESEACGFIIEAIETAKRGLGILDEQDALENIQTSGTEDDVEAKTKLYQGRVAMRSTYGNKFEGIKRYLQGRLPNTALSRDLELFAGVLDNLLIEPRNQPAARTLIRARRIIAVTVKNLLDELKT